MFTPIPLHLPPCSVKLKQENGKVFIFDSLRKKYLVATPEEWVRQHWIDFLIQTKGYPKTLIQAEGGLKLNSLQKRTDLIIFNPQGKRILIAEFKAPHISINQNTFDQIARYNMTHQVPLLLVSNGLQHFYCRINFDESTYTFLSELPSYDTLLP